MLDDVRMMLARGIAAAKAGPQGKDEARSHLERVVRANAEPDQKATAWLWLSRVEEDPAKKRRCLESALALDPGNGQAHQWLSILDGELKPEDILDPHDSIQPVKPTRSASETEVRRFVCPNCGGRMSFSAGQPSVSCNYCGAPFSDSGSGSNK